MELRIELEDQDLPDDEIDQRVNQLRQELKSRREQNPTGSQSADNTPSYSAKGYDPVHAKSLRPSDVHRLAAAKEKEMTKFASALGVRSDYRPGEAFEDDYRERQRARRAAERQAQRQEREERKSQYRAQREAHARARQEQADEQKRHRREERPEHLSRFSTRDREATRRPPSPIREGDEPAHHPSALLKRRLDLDSRPRRGAGAQSEFELDAELDALAVERARARAHDAKSVSPRPLPLEGREAHPDQVTERKVTHSPSRSDESPRSPSPDRRSPDAALSSRGHARSRTGTGSRSLSSSPTRSRSRSRSLSRSRFDSRSRLPSRSLPRSRSGSFTGSYTPSSSRSASPVSPSPEADAGRHGGQRRGSVDARAGGSPAHVRSYQSHSPSPPRSRSPSPRADDSRPRRY